MPTYKVLIKGVQKMHRLSIVAEEFRLRENHVVFLKGKGLSKDGSAEVALIPLEALISIVDSAASEGKEDIES